MWGCPAVGSPAGTRRRRRRRRRGTTAIETHRRLLTRIRICALSWAFAWSGRRESNPHHQLGRQFRADSLTWGDVTKCALTCGFASLVFLTNHARSDAIVSRLCHGVATSVESAGAGLDRRDVCGVRVSGGDEQRGGVVRVQRTAVLPADRLDMRCRSRRVVDEHADQDTAVAEFEYRWAVPVSADRCRSPTIHTDSESVPFARSTPA
jgi:hypothetical protein